MSPLRTNAPRFLCMPVYVVLDLATLMLIGDFTASVPAMVLICAGGPAHT